jgi:hypothetical protein
MIGGTKGERSQRIAIFLFVVPVENWNMLPRYHHRTVYSAHPRGKKMRPPITLRRRLGYTMSCLL